MLLLHTDLFFVDVGVSDLHNEVHSSDDTNVIAKMVTTELSLHLGERSGSGWVQIFTPGSLHKGGYRPLSLTILTYIFQFLKQK